MKVLEIAGIEQARKYAEENETDHYRFAYKDFVCVIKRMPHMGHLCGYLEVKELQFDKDRVKEIAEEHFHGGVSWDDGETLGFDCAHACDLPLEYPLELPGSTYKTVEYVKQNLFKTVDAIVSDETAWRG